MDNPLVLKTCSTGAEVAGIQKIFSNSSCKSANSFCYLTRSQSSLSSSSRQAHLMVIILLCLQKFQGLKSRTGTCKLVLDDPRWRGLSSGTTTLSLGTLPVAIVHVRLWPALRDIWRNVSANRGRAYATVLRPSACLSVRMYYD